MWLEFMAMSARLPMPGKGKMFQVKIYCPFNFLPPEPQPNSIPSAEWHVPQASHIANAHVVSSPVRRAVFSYILYSYLQKQPVFRQIMTSSFSCIAIFGSVLSGCVMGQKLNRNL